MKKCLNCKKKLVNYTAKRCKSCAAKERIRMNGSPNYKQDVHHIDYNKNNCNEDNLISLCRKCNIKANHNRDYWFALFIYVMEGIGYENNRD